MTINHSNLKKKYLKIIHEESYCEDRINEVLFGYSELKSTLDSNKIGSVLEIGTGTGMLLSELKLAYPEIDMFGLEPHVDDHSKFEKIYRELDTKKIKIFNEKIEDFKTDIKFDLIFSINVIEHVNDYENFIVKAHRFLKKNGKIIILCPNYDFPYESHYAIPIIINKNITKKIFNSYIKFVDKKQNHIGRWENLNFISKKKLIKFLQNKNVKFFFDNKISDRMLQRIFYDKGLQQRQGILMSIVAKIGKLLLLEKIIFNLLGFSFPYMKIIISKD